MKKLPLLFLFFILALACSRPKVIDPDFPWPASGVDEADSLLLVLERARTSLDVPDSTKRLIATRFSQIAAKHPDNTMLQMRSLYLEGCTLLAKNPEAVYQLINERLPQFDSVAYPYDWHALMALKLPTESSLFEQYAIASDNVDFFEKNGAGIELARNLVIKGNTLTNIGDTTHALQCYDRAASIFSRYNDLRGVYSVEINRMPLRSFAENKKTIERMLADSVIARKPILQVPLLQNAFYFTDSLPFLDSAINIVNRENIEIRDLACLLSMKADCLVDLGKPQEALALVPDIIRAEQALNPFTRVRPSIHHHLAAIYSANNMPDSAVDQMNLAAFWTDSLQREYNYKGIYSSETKFHIQAAEQNARLKRHEMILWWIFSVFIVVAVAALVYLKLKKDALKREAELRLLDEKIHNEQRLNFAQSSLLEESERLLSDIDSTVTSLYDRKLISSPGRDEIAHLAASYRSNEQSRQGFLRINRDVDNDFSKRLKADFPDLAESQIRLAALIAAGVDSHQLANILNISPKSIYTSRYRLRTRLGLSKADSLEDFLRRYSHPE